MITRYSETRDRAEMWEANEKVEWLESSQSDALLRI